jgi:hypothetical protein
MDRSKHSLKIAKFINPIKENQQSHGQQKMLVGSKHWKNSNRIDLGVNVVHKLSDKSKISYPNLKKTQYLPKLSQVSQEPSKVAIMDPTQQQFISKNHIVLPEIEQIEDDEFDFDWVFLQQRTIEINVKNNIENTNDSYIPISVANNDYEIPKVVLFQSFTLQHIYHSSSIKLLTQTNF